MRTFNISVAGVILLAMLSAEGNFSQASEVVFEKPMSKAQKLVVSRVEIPFIPPSAEDIKELQETFPGQEGEFMKPDHVYEYFLILSSFDDKQQKKLWSKKSLYYKLGPGMLTELKILDATFESDTLIIVFKEESETFVEVVAAEQEKTGKGSRQMVLSKDGAFARSIVTFAKIEGSFKDDSVVVNLKFADGKSTQWTFKKNEWVEVKPPEDVHAKDNYGRTPLFEVASKGSVQRVEELLKKGAKIDAKDDHGTTPLMFAVGGEKANAECIKALLAGGANINATDNQGWTPLMHATQGGNMEVVKLLIARGADVNARTKEGMYPLRLPIKRNDHAMIELLKKAGAKE